MDPYLGVGLAAVATRESVPSYDWAFDYVKGYEQRWYEEELLQVIRDGMKPVAAEREMLVFHTMVQ